MLQPNCVIFLRSLFSDMDVFQTDWKERHESRGSIIPPTLLDVWQGYIGDGDETKILEKITVPTIFNPDDGI